MKLKVAKTKILCTLGPSTDSVEKIKSLIHNGADGLRLNFSHGSFDYYETLFKNIETAINDEQLPLTVLQDLQGPKIRVGDIEGGAVEIKAGNKIEITIEDIKGTAEKISTSYKRIIDDAAIGDKILINDGLLKLIVIDKKDNSIVCEIIEGGVLSSRKGMNLPGMNISLPAVTEKDLEALEFAASKRLDFIALSFVRKAEDIIKLRSWLERKYINKPIIAKIEKKEAVDNFEEILKAADGIMIARGDLGVEMQPQEVPLIQKSIIKRCNEVGKIVITATQMLESMIQNPVPTRAEASDVANAVWDGTDVVMLSGETSVGKYPIEAVKMMNDILVKTETTFPYTRKINYEVPELIQENLFDSTGRAINIIADQVKAKIIVVFSYNGRKAKVISKYRPNAKIIAITNRHDTVAHLNLYWGISAYYMEDIEDPDTAVVNGLNLLKDKFLAFKDDIIVFTSGVPISDKSRQNWIRFATI